MVKVAVICEYNPFHNGHAKQIGFIRNHFPDEEVCVVCIMSGNYVQRADVAVAHKYKRAEWAVKCGADLVLELPFPHSMGMAEDFARASVGIAHGMGDIDYLCFGSESGDTERIMRCAQNLSDETFCHELALRVRSSHERSYAAHREGLYYELFGEELLTRPNDILAIEYVKALNSYGSSIGILACRRKSDFSATASRKAIFARNADELCDMVSADVVKYFEENQPCSLSDVGEYICTFYSLADPYAFCGIYEMNFDLASKICSTARAVTSVNELIDAVSDKRYTRARVRRALISGVLSVSTDSVKRSTAYTTLLACTSRGRAYLSKYEGELPVITRKAELSGKADEVQQFLLGSKADGLYNRILEKKSTPISKKPYICE